MSTLKYCYSYNQLLTLFHFIHESSCFSYLNMLKFQFWFYPFFFNVYICKEPTVFIFLQADGCVTVNYGKDWISPWSTSTKKELSEKINPELLKYNVGLRSVFRSNLVILF